MRTPEHYTENVWTFDSPQEPHFIVPTVSELEEAWERHHSSQTFARLHESMYGICTKPPKQPTAVIAVDLCEVVRQTGASFTKLYTNDPASTAHDYNVYYGEDILGENAQAMREIMAPELMHADAVEPVPYTDAIQAFMQRWKSQGIYIIANTSTLPGCETSTVKYLADYFPGSFQGILLPRNHDGKGKTTKPEIFSHTKAELELQTGFDFTNIPSLCIEDAYHHGSDYVTHPDSIHVFMPEYSWNQPLDGHPDISRVTQRFGTVDTFIAVDEYLASRGIVK